MPNLWSETIEAHRREVREAILDTAAALVAEHGLLSVTMSQIAEKTGIGRATLYKYFSDVEAILLAWHERQISRHLEQLAAVRDQTRDAGERLEAVLEAYALIQWRRVQHHELARHGGDLATQEGAHDPRHGHHLHHGGSADHGQPGDTEVAALLHRGEHFARARQQLTDLIRDLLMEAAKTGDVRSDLPADELGVYCLHALAGASDLPSEAAVRRLVTVTLAGLRPAR